MSILSAIRTAYGYEDAFGAKDSTTQEMRSAIEEWFALYYNREATKDEDPCQRIAYRGRRDACPTGLGGDIGVICFYVACIEQTFLTYYLIYHTI